MYRMNHSCHLRTVYSWLEWWTILANKLLSDFCSESKLFSGMQGISMHVTCLSEGISSCTSPASRGRSTPFEPPRFISLAQLSHRPQS